MDAALETNIKDASWEVFILLFSSTTAGQTRVNRHSHPLIFLSKMYQRALLFSALMAAARAQQAGTLKTETHPSLSWQKCTSGGCTDQSGSVVIDSNWRWVHSTDGSTNCYTGNEVRTFPMPAKPEIDICNSGTRLFARMTRPAPQTVRLTGQSMNPRTVSRLTAMP